MLTMFFTDNLIAQDKRERKAVEALQEKQAKRDNTDSLRTAHY